LELIRFSAHVTAMQQNGEPLDVVEIERGFREAAMRDGSALLCEFLSKIPDGVPLCPACGKPMGRKDMREKDIESLLGSGRVSRGYYGCATCHEHAIPKDHMLGIEATSFTTGVRHSVDRLASAEPFEWCSEVLEEIVGINVSAKEIQRIAEADGAHIEAGFSAFKDNLFTGEAENEPFAKQLRPPDDVGTVPVMYIEYDGTGIPMVRREAANRKGKQKDGSAKTREAKLGCIFTQTGKDDKGNPLRDDGSTTYFGAIETADEFGQRVYANAVRCGLGTAGTVVVLGDGAKWIWNLASVHFPGALEIVDLYHAKEHVWKIIEKADADTGRQHVLKTDWSGMLEAGEIEEMVQAIEAYLMANFTKEEIESETGYFTTNAKRMRYADFKKQGLFVGSGVIEAGCKTVVGSRCKRSGMFWTVGGANAILALRCHHISRKTGAARQAPGVIAA